MQVKSAWFVCRGSFGSPVHLQSAHGPFFIRQVCNSNLHVIGSFQHGSMRGLCRWPTEPLEDASNIHVDPRFLDWKLYRDERNTQRVQSVALKSHQSAVCTTATQRSSTHTTTTTLQPRHYNHDSALIETVSGLCQDARCLPRDG